MLTLLLLPGMDGTGKLFEPFKAALGPEFQVRVVAYPTSGPLGYAELEAHARACLPQRGPFVILGESFSGPIAVSIAASRPNGLAGLVLCSTFARNPRPWSGCLRRFVGMLPVQAAPLPVLSALLLGSFSTPALRSALRSAMSGVSPQALRARLRAVLQVDVSAQLEAVTVPTLYLMATHDRVVPASSFKHIRNVLPAVQLACINAPHFLLQAAPAEAAQAVGAFIRLLQSSR